MRWPTEYVSTFPQLIWHIPASLPYDHAAPMGGIALSTAAQVSRRLSLKAKHYLTEWLGYLPSIQYTLHRHPQARTRMFITLLSSVVTSLQFLVWAGSTGVGMYAIKLASLLGYRVVTTASPHNFELVKSLGASAVFDYKDPGVPTKIQQWIKDQNIGPLTKGIDTISESKDSMAANGAVIGSSIRLSLQAFGDSEGTLVTLCTFPFACIRLV